MRWLAQWIAHLLRRLFVPTIQRGDDPNLWCGRYLIVSAPPAISRLFGRGEIGLELYRSIHRAENPKRQT